ncbi:MAG TPA: aromatic ring-hydroxylating dioxygenase subunit alpha [Stellaceae bacterium]|nr:aromatic ring-hydroxylating dioxygenase subunit alpha [Stellaceae bacterium]
MADDAIPESRSRWDVLTTTGAGTPMGELLRRYWWPIAGASELDASPTKPVRLMGENLVLYKDLSGNYGLIDRHCKHRRADLSYGYVEKCGLRCNYHGWLYDHTGRCAEQPYEDMAHPESRFKDQVRITAYPVRELGGLLWAYLGPAPAPLVPNWEFFTWKNGFRQIVTAEIPCNWFQCQENSIDPVHFEWTHSNWSVRLKGATGPYSPQHVKVDFNEFDWGFQYKRIRTDTSAEDRLWTIGRVCLWPNALFTGNHCEFRVPIDDHNTLSITWHFSRVPRDREPYVQDKVPAWRGPIADPQTGRWVTSHVMNQDFVTWVGQGGIADRTKETLAPSDRGVVMVRRRFLADLEAIAQGKDPKAIVRDEAVNQCIMLPVAERASLVDGFTREQLMRDPFNRRSLQGYIFQVGQPAEVRNAFLAAMGINATEVAGAEVPLDPLAPAPSRN